MTAPVKKHSTVNLAYHFDPVAMLRELADDLEKGRANCSDIVITWLEKKGHIYKSRFYRSPMSAERHLFLLEAGKLQVWKDMENG